MKFETYNLQGTVGGVLVYYIEEIDASVSMAFYAGDDNNYWSVITYSGDSPASEALYVLQILFTSQIADDHWHEGALDSGLKYRVFMSTGPQAVLKIHIKHSE